MAAHLSLVESETAASAADAKGGGDPVRDAGTTSLLRRAIPILFAMIAWLPLAVALLFIVLGHPPIPNT